jgi:hypothetical protein
VKGLDQFVDVVEREAYVFNVEVKDPTAPVDFFIKGVSRLRRPPTGGTRSSPLLLLLMWPRGRRLQK